MNMNEQEWKKLSICISMLVSSIGDRSQSSDDKSVLRDTVSSMLDSLEDKYGSRPALAAMRGNFIGNHALGMEVDREYLHKYDRIDSKHEFCWQLSIAS